MDGPCGLAAHDDTLPTREVWRRYHLRQTLTASRPHPRRWLNTIEASAAVLGLASHVLMSELAHPVISLRLGIWSLSGHSGLCHAAHPTNLWPHGQFSGGQRQRICIARALAMEPELLIADEAVSALDMSVQKQVLELLDEIRQRLNLAVLFITHDLRVAAQICDYVAVMSKGRVVEYGSAEQVFGSPRDEYTKALFAAAPGRNWEFGKFATA